MEKDFWCLAGKIHGAKNPVIETRLDMPIEILFRFPLLQVKHGVLVVILFVGGAVYASRSPLGEANHRLEDFKDGLPFIRKRYYFKKTNHHA